MKQKNKTLRRLSGILTMLLIATAATVYVNDDLNVADLLNGQVTGQEDVIYMPSYEATVGTGQIEIMAGGPMDPFDSLTFLMDFQPTESLTFSDSPLVFDQTTLIQNPTFQEATLVQPGRLEVTVTTAAEVSTAEITTDSSTHKPLFKIETQVAGGQNILFNFDEVVVMNGDQSLDVTTIPPSLISIQTNNNQDPIPQQEQVSQNTEPVEGAPVIDLGRSYMAPSLLNQGDVGTLYTFIEDDNVLQVVADVSDLGYVGSHNSGVLGADQPAVDLSTVDCSTFNLNTTTVACLQKNVDEPTGIWYTLQNITVDVPARPEPYLIQLHATDLEGKTSTQSLPVYVGVDGARPAQPLAAVATAESQVEILFDKALDPTSIAPDGSDFNILSEASLPLIVSGASLNEVGTVVTLTTSAQAPNTTYQLTASEQVKDIFGEPVAQGDSNQLEFMSFTLSNKSPLVDYVSSMDLNRIELEFENPLKLSSTTEAVVSVHQAENPSAALEVVSMNVLSANAVELVTATQTSAQRYRIMIEGLASSDGTTSPVAIEVGIKGSAASNSGLHSAAGCELESKGDLDCSGEVDFNDFTIFAANYGKTASGSSDNTPSVSSNNNEAASGDIEFQAIVENPDATVPITSEANGGAIQF